MTSRDTRWRETCSCASERRRRWRRPRSLSTSRRRWRPILILLKDIDPAGESYPYDLTRVGDSVFFSANKTGTDDTYWEVWKTDGTGPGTRRVRHTGYTDAQDLTRVGNRLFFEAFEDGMDYELWVSDGTKAGTHVVEDIDPTGDSSIDELTAIGNTLFLHADDGAHGAELWRSDWTATGTKQVRNIAPGPSSSSPSQLRTSAAPSISVPTTGPTDASRGRATGPRPGRGC